MQAIKIIFSFILFAFCASAAHAEPEKFVRVAIVQDAKSLNIYINGFFKIVDSVSNRVLTRGKALKAIFTPSQKGILSDGLPLKSSNIIIEVKDPESLSINGRKFRGNIQFINKNNGHLLAVNFVELEDYVKGILYHEVSHYWPEEALKAQAIACRTYALYQMNLNFNKDFDLTCDIYSQVYGGKTSERYRTNNAVDQTKGEALEFKGKIFPAYFHATCAGHTEDAALLWNLDIAPLKGVACNFCKESPHYRWHQVLDIGKIKEALVKAGYKGGGRIEKIEILNKNPSGRIAQLQIQSLKDNFEISGKDFRMALGPNIIRSANFSVRLEGNDAVFEGLGWGHGVGMCQWGAYFMAKQGYDYKKILQFYYPQSNVKTF